MELTSFELMFSTSIVIKDVLFHVFDSIQMVSSELVIKIFIIKSLSVDQWHSY